MTDHDPNNYAHYTVRLITPDDWCDYRDYYKRLSDPHHFREILEGQDLDAPETYAKLFSQTIGTNSFVMFGLWHRNKMIGQSSIDFSDTHGRKKALLAGSEIADEYRGRRLVNKFYAARMQYLRDIKFEGDITTTIRPGNHQSIKAAERNGFASTGSLDEHGYLIFVPVGLHPAQAIEAPSRPTTDLGCAPKSVGLGSAGAGS
ncbi:MAG: GNAT family protein [Alphaproteobacteria bacterium]|nr:GNAT family protein [Alphaproteobacteria bacterium]